MERQKKTEHKKYTNSYFYKWMAFSSIVITALTVLIFKFNAYSVPIFLLLLCFMIFTSYFLDEKIENHIKNMKSRK